MPAIRPVICGQISSRLSPNGSGAPMMAPRICIGSMGPSVLVSGLSRPSTASLNSVPGESRIIPTLSDWTAR